MTSGDAHLANFPLLLERGLDGLREKVAERRSCINLTVLEDLHGEQFLKAIYIVLVAVSEHIDVCCPCARTGRDLKPAKAVAMNCWRWQKTAILIAHQPPQTFWQALQLCYFIQLILQIESTRHSDRLVVWTSILSCTIAASVELNQTLDCEHAIQRCLDSCWLKLLEVSKIPLRLTLKSLCGKSAVSDRHYWRQNLVDGLNQWTR
ncbi:pyruvate formate lyase family protein [Shigella flexneri]